MDFSSSEGQLLIEILSIVGTKSPAAMHYKQKYHMIHHK